MGEDDLLANSWKQIETVLGWLRSHANKHSAEELDKKPSVRDGSSLRESLGSSTPHSQLAVSLLDVARKTERTKRKIK